MDGFVYGSIVIATLLYVAGFIILFRYKHDKIKQLEEQLNALNNMLDSSDKMVDELNNLSDYVTSNIENKTKELKSLLTIADEKIKDFKLASTYNFKPTKQQSSNDLNNKTESNIDSLIDDISQIKKPEFDKVTPIKKSFSAVIGAYENNKNLLNNYKKNENEILENEKVNNSDDNEEKQTETMVNTKEDEIHNLLNQGMSTTEIAKMLGIGKGEIELILGLKK